MLTPEQAETIKQRLKEHIDSTFPEDRKESAKEQVDQMSPDELEELLIKNNLINSSSSLPGQQKCVFCSIVSGDIPSHDISANEFALAVLEINPLSRGHVLIIPKEHVGSEKEMPSEVKSFAKKISALLKKKLLAEKIKTEYSNLLGHEIINLIPIYEGSAVPIHRYKETTEQLNALRDLLVAKADETKKPDTRLLSRKRKPGKVKELVEKIEEKFFWLPKRIP